MTYPEKLRLVLALGGLGFLIAGIATESRLIVWVAIALLGLAFILRLYLRRNSR
jgi:hypothetical protein